MMYLYLSLIWFNFNLNYQPQYFPHFQIYTPRFNASLVYINPYASLIAMANTNSNTRIQTRVDCLLVYLIYAINVNAPAKPPTEDQRPTHSP